MLAAARRTGTVVTMDPLSNLPDLLAGAAAFLPHVDHFLPNEEQAAAMTGESDPEKAAVTLPARPLVVCEVFPHALELADQRRDRQR